MNSQGTNHSAGYPGDKDNGQTCLVCGQVLSVFTDKSQPPLWPVGAEVDNGKPCPGEWQPDKPQPATAEDDPSVIVLKRSADGKPLSMLTDNIDIGDMMKVLEALNGGPTTAEVHHVEYVDGEPCIRVPVEWLEGPDE